MASQGFLNGLVSGGPDAARAVGQVLLLHRYHRNRDLLEANLAGMRAYIKALANARRSSKKAKPQIPDLSENALPMWLLVCPFVADDSRQLEASRAAVRAYIDVCPLQSERHWWASRLGADGVRGFVHPVAALGAASGRTAAEAREREEASKLQALKDEETEAARIAAEVDDQRAARVAAADPTSDEAIAAADLAAHDRGPEVDPEAEDIARERAGAGKALNTDGVSFTQEEIEALGLDKKLGVETLEE